MKILSTHEHLTTNFMKYMRKGLMVSFSVLPLLHMQISSKPLEKDVFEYRESNLTNESITEDSTNLTMLNSSPVIKIAGEYKLATIVVDTGSNKLYHYDKDGSLIKEYSVATGKETTPTDKGIRKVSWVENYPYRTAPASTKRRKSPWEYGPRVIVIGVVDQVTGKITHYNGEFIHGTNKPESIGTHASKGCVRLNNEDIEELAAQMLEGMYVVIK